MIAKTRGPAAASITATSGSATVTAGVAPRAGADVWLVRYDPRTVRVPVKAGENTGKTLSIRNVVRSLTRLGTWDGPQATFRYPAAAAGLNSVVIVQSRDGGPILAAARA